MKPTLPILQTLFRDVLKMQEVAENSSEARNMEAAFMTGIILMDPEVVRPIAKMCEVLGKRFLDL